MEASFLDAALTEDQDMIAQAVREFADASVAPRHEALDHHGEHPEELWGEIAELGLFGAMAPESVGGAGAGAVGHLVVIESLARAAGLAGILPCAQGIAIDALLGTDDGAARDRWLPSLLAGEVLGAPALAETLVGAPVQAQGEGLDVTLHGERALAPFPGRAGLFVVRARRGGDDLLVAVDGAASGVTHEAAASQLGVHGLEFGGVAFDKTPGRVLGRSDLLDRVMGGARMAVAAFLGGVARGAIGHAARYSTERKQFKTEIRNFGAIQERLARADARVEGLRALAHGAARLRDQGLPFAQAARRARLLAHDVAPGAADDAVQIYGGFGFSREYPVERFYRDALFCGFGEFTPAQVNAESTVALT